jgi:hypothetical protein
MQQLPKSVESKLLPALKDLKFEENMFVDNLPENGIVAEIPDFQGLGPIMQENGKAIFQIVAADTRPLNKGAPWAGNVWADAEERIKGFEGKMKILADAVEETLK